VIRAGVTALGLDIWNITVLIDDLLDKVREILAHKIGDDTDTLWEASIESLLDEPGPTEELVRENRQAILECLHILLQHGNNITSITLIAPKDVLGTQKSTLLSTVPMEFESVLKPILHQVRVGDSPERLQNCDSSRPIVICTRCTQERWQEQVDRVLMSANDNSFVSSSWNSRNQRALLPLVCKLLDVELGLVILWKGSLDPLEQPVATLAAVLGLVVPRMETGEFLKVGLHVLLAKRFENRVDFVLELWLIGVFDLAEGLDESRFAERLVVRNVHEVDLVLIAGHWLAFGIFELGRKISHTFFNSSFCCSVTHRVSAGLIWTKRSSSVGADSTPAAVKACC
jgi:hypothetical protein